MVKIKTEKEIEILKEAGKKLASILYAVLQEVKIGVSASTLDKYAEKLIYDSGGKPSFKRFKTKESLTPFPSSLCVSLNDEVVHGIPENKKIFKESDLVSLDIGMEYKGLYVDMARTVGIEKIDKTGKRLLNVGKKALEIAISEAYEGNYIGNIGEAVQKFTEINGFGVVRKLVGHGVGYSVHEEPEIPNFGCRGSGLKLKKGMVLALEPMVTEGDFDVSLDDNGWTWRLKNGMRAVHFEDTVLVEKKKGKALTR
jgi:methionyl aminopeptidase